MGARKKRGKKHVLKKRRDNRAFLPCPSAGIDYLQRKRGDRQGKSAIGGEKRRTVL